MRPAFADTASATASTQVSLHMVQENPLCAAGAPKTQRDQSCAYPHPSPSTTCRTRMEQFSTHGTTAFRGGFFFLCPGLCLSAPTTVPICPAARNGGSLACRGNASRIPTRTIKKKKNQGPRDHNRGTATTCACRAYTESLTLTASNHLTTCRPPITAHQQKRPARFAMPALSVDAQVAPIPCQV